MMPHKKLPLLLLFFCVLLPLPVEAAPPTSTMKMVHRPPAAARSGAPLTLRGQVPENEELEEVYLRYRRKGETRYRSARMILYGGDRYRVTLKAYQVRPPALEYYVTGLDLDKKWHLLFASPQQPHSLPVTTKTTQRPAPRTARPSSTPTLPLEDDKTDDLETPKESDTVYSAGRREQRLQNAPGVITVITAAQIQAAGWRNLVDILRFAVGIDINNNGYSPDIGVRGLNPRLAYGDKLIILIDGHNMVWRQFNRNLLNTSWVSVDNIKRIEIIRGPGSALWGANALSGVINIITKTNQDLKGFQINGGGSPLSQSYFFNLQGGQEVFGGLTFRGSFSLQQQNLSPLLAPIYEFKKKSNVDYIPSGMQTFSQNFYAQLTWRGFNLRFHQSRYAPSAVISSSNLIAGSSVIGADDSRLSTDRYIARLSWTTLLGSWGTFSLWTSFDTFGYNHNAQLEINPLSPFNSSARLKGDAETFALYEKATGGRRLQFKNYYPACSEIPKGSSTPCIKFARDERDQPVCSLVNSPREDAQKGQFYAYSAYIPKACRHAYQNGRYLIQPVARDYRFEAGLLMNALLFERLSINTGFEFEYLDILGYHFPAFLNANRSSPPHFTNYHLSAFLQLQYNFGGYVEVTAGGRFDYDQIYGFVPTPRAAVVFTPGLGFYGKLLYGNAFKAPAIQDLYMFLDRNAIMFGNPSLRPESVHTFEVQLGWYRRRLLALSVNGYLSFFNDLITPIRRDKHDEFLGENDFPEEKLPSRTEDFIQKANTSQMVTYGGELELRLFLVKGLHIIGSFGLYFGQDDQGNPLQFTSPFQGRLSLSYRLPLGPVSLLFAAGALIAGSKSVPPTDFSLPNTTLPAEDLSPPQSIAVPSWTAKEDPSQQTPLFLQTYVTLQLLRLLKNIDLGLRLSNLLNREQYDANEVLFYPQPRLDLLLWMRLRL